MTKGKQRQKVSGAVLVMVLIVMVVLIMMLMATLTVVTTANQRIYTKYEENQAYYTARSALDVFMNNLMTDATYIAQDDSGAARQFTDDASATTVDMKQGLALQLDLYKIKSQNQDGVDWGWAENVCPADAVFASGSSDETYYAMDDATGIPYMEYEITFPTISDGSGTSYGKFVDIHDSDLDGDGLKDDQVAKIRIEVLDRKLAMATEYTDAEIAAATNTSVPSIADIKASIAAGNRSKDLIKVKLTSTVEMMGTEGVAVVIFETTKKLPPSGGPDDQYGKQNSSSGANGSSGGFGMMEASEFKLDANKLTGTGYTPGVVNLVSSSEMSFAGGSSIVAMDGIKQGNAISINAEEPNSFIFSGGEFIVTNSFDTTAGENVPIIADKITKSGDADLKTSDLYVKDLVIDDNNSNKIHVTNTSYVQNITFASNQFYSGGWGDPMVINMGAFANMNIQMCSGFTFTGPDGVVHDVSDYGGGWTAKDEWGNEFATIADFLAAYGGTVNAFDVNTFSTTLVDGSRIFRVYDLPFSMENGNNTIEVATHQANFYQLFDESAYDANGDLIMASGVAIDYSDLYSEDNIDAWIKDAADMFAEYADIDTSVTPVTIDSLIADTSDSFDIRPISELLSTYTMNAGKKYVEVNVDAGDVYYYFDTDFMDYEIRVKGTGNRLILFLGEDDTVEMRQSYITTDDLNLATTEVIYGDTQASPVDIYCGTDSVFSMTNKSYIAGYLNIPTGYLNVDGGPLNNVQYTGSNGNTETFNDVYLSGRGIAGETNTSNKPTNTGLGSDSGGSKPGEPHLTVNAAEYARS